MCVCVCVSPDGVRAYGRGEVCVQDPSLAHVRVYDQLHPQAQAPAGEVHDEQRTGELHYSTGELAHLDLFTADSAGRENVTLEIHHVLYQDRILCLLTFW